MGIIACGYRIFFEMMESFKLEVLITGVVKEDFWGRKPLSWFVIGDD